MIFIIMPPHLGSTVPLPPDEIVQTLKALQEAPTSDAWFAQWSDALNALSDTFISALWYRHLDVEDEEARKTFKAVSQLRAEVENLSATLEKKALAHETDNPRLTAILERMKRQHRLHQPEVTKLEAVERDLKDAYDALETRQVIEQASVGQVMSELPTEPSRTVRRSLWQRCKARRAEDYGAVDKLFLDLVEIRRAIGDALGMSFRDYIWQKKGRYEYAPEDCLRWLEAINASFANMQAKLKKYNTAQLGAEKIRPWDVGVTPTYQGRTFDEATYLSLAKRAYTDILPEFGAEVQHIAQRGHADLMARSGKRTRFMSSILVLNNEPVVYCCNVGNLQGLRVTLHEFGHAIHYSAYTPGKYMFELPAPLEIAEFSAYTLQMLATERLTESEWLSEEESTHLLRVVLNQVLGTFNTFNTHERFQYWVYEDARRSATELDDYYMNLPGDALVDWTGLEQHERKRWQYRQLVAEPFYSAEYVITWIAVLLFWRRYKTDSTVLERFFETLRFAKTKTVGETFDYLGINFPFSSLDIAQAAETLEDEFMHLIDES